MRRFRSSKKKLISWKVFTLSDREPFFLGIVKALSYEKALARARTEFKDKNVWVESKK